MSRKATPVEGPDEAPNEGENLPATSGLDQGRAAKGRGHYLAIAKEFAKLPDEDKHKLLKDNWKEIAFLVSSRAKQFVATCSPKDFGQMYRIIMSGAVSIDKAFPPREHQGNAPAFVVNLFGSLGQRAASITTPPVPIIEAKEVQEWPSSDSKTKTLLLPTSSVTSPTTTPSTPSLKKQ